MRISLVNYHSGDFFIKGYIKAIDTYYDLAENIQNIPQFWNTIWSYFRDNPTGLILVRAGLFTKSFPHLEVIKNLPLISLDYNSEFSSGVGMNEITIQLFDNSVVVTLPDIYESIKTDFLDQLWIKVFF